MSKQNITLGIAIIALIVGAFGLVGGNNSQSENLGSTGTRFPNGLSTNSTSPTAGKLVTTDITADTSVLVVDGTTKNNVGVGTTTATVNADFVVDGSATSTIYLGSSSATKGGCIQWDDAYGSTSAVYIKNGNIFVQANGMCK